MLYSDVITSHEKYRLIKDSLFYPLFIESNLSYALSCADRGGEFIKLT